MILDDLLFDEVNLLRPHANWKWCFEVGGGYDQELSPSNTGAKLLLGELQRIGADDELRQGIFANFEGRLKEIEADRNASWQHHGNSDYLIDIDAFISQVQRYMSAVIPSMNVILADRDINVWMSVYMKLSPRIHEELSVRLEQTNPELKGPVKPIVGALDFHGRLALLSGKCIQPGIRDIEDALETMPVEHLYAGIETPSI